MSRNLDQRRAAILDGIATLGPAMPGSLVFRHTAARGPTVAAEPTHLDCTGPTRPGPARSTARPSPDRCPEQAERFQPCFDDAHRLRDLVDQLRQLAIEQAQPKATGPPPDVQRPPNWRVAHSLGPMPARPLRHRVTRRVGWQLPGPLGPMECGLQRSSLK
jgi:hypothetical protein